MPVCTVATYAELVSELAGSCTVMTIAADIAGPSVRIARDMQIAGSDAYRVPPLTIDAATVEVANLILGADASDPSDSACNVVIDGAIGGLAEATLGPARGAPAVCMLRRSTLNILGAWIDTSEASGIVLAGTGSTLTIAPPATDGVGLSSAGGTWPLIVAESGSTIDTTRLDVEADPATAPPAQILAFDSNTSLVDPHFDGGRRAIYVDGGQLQVRGTGASSSGTARFTDLATTLGGAAIAANAGADVTITNVRFAQDTANGDGGAILAFGSGGSLTVTGSLFEDCWAGGVGGAIATRATDIAVATSYSYFRTGGSTSGGAIAVVGGAYEDLGSAFSSLLVPDGTDEAGSFSRLGRGGAIFLDSVTRARVEGAYFDGNRAEGGGAIWVQDPAIPSPDGRDVTIGTSHFGDNRARYAGGAVWVGATGENTAVGTEIVGSTFVHNRTDDTCDACFSEGAWWDGGGAVWLGGLGGTVEGSLFCANGAPVRGGAIRVGARIGQSNRPSFTVLNSGFYQNAAFVGAAVKNHAGPGALAGEALPSAALILRNVTFAANGSAETTGTADYVNGSTVITPSDGFEQRNNLYYDALWGVQLDRDATSVASAFDSAWGTSAFQGRPHGEPLLLPSEADYGPDDAPYADPAFVRYPTASFPSFDPDLDAVDCDAVDFHLSPGSPARGAGQDSAGNAVDLGMYGALDLDLDGWAQGPDCDDEDAAVNPDAAEVLDNGVDDDCDGTAAVSADTDDTDTEIAVDPEWFGGRTCGCATGRPGAWPAALLLLFLRRRR